MPIVNQKPEPLFASVPRAVCPVCGTASYSRSGIHPQCAMAASDQVQSARIEARNLAQPKTAAAKLKHYEKRCPKCKTIQHVRRRTCECGHVL